eukprot:Awhi_evm1s14961
MNADFADCSGTVGNISSIHIGSSKRFLGTLCARDVKSGKEATKVVVPNRKQPVEKAFVTRLGVAGDEQREDFIKIWGGHGGLEKAVMLFSQD